MSVNEEPTVVLQSYQVMSPMGCFVSTACCVRWEVKSFGDDKEEVLDDKEGEGDVDELDEEDVEERYDSESSLSEGLVAFCFKDGNTVGSWTD